MLSQKNSGQAFSQMARSAAVNYANGSATQWLNQFGQAQVGINLDNNNTLSGSYLDLLLPLYETEQALFFTQLGGRERDHRWTGNLGIGARYYHDNWMTGINSFFDNDFTGNNRRVGVGVELARDYFRLSGNGYFRITNWHQSRDFADYDERPANGYDIRTEGWLPAYPQLGASLIYERYFGDEVALFGKDQRQHDPQAVTVGVNYTPVPLITLAANHRKGTGGHNDTQMNLQVNYRIGDSWDQLLDSERVQTSRTLMGSRYDLVNRNNNIVLDYKKQTLVTVSLPARISGHAAEVLTLKAQSWSKYPLDALDWDVASLIAAGGKIVGSGKESLSVLLPAYRYSRQGVPNDYAIGVTARDVKGNVSPRSQSWVSVEPALAQIGTLDVLKDKAIANGQDSNQVRVTLLDGLGAPLPQVEVNFSSSVQAQLTPAKVLSDAQGQAVVNLTYTQLGRAPVTVTVGDKQQTVNTEFTADRASATIDAGSYVITHNNAWADGGTENQVQGKVLDKWGHPVADMPVTISATNGALPKETEVKTDVQGIFRASAVSKKAGIAAINASVNGQQQSLNSQFVADNGTATPTLTLVTDNQPANEKAYNQLLVNVLDANNNPVKGQVIQATATNGAVLKEKEVTTDADGNATVSVASRQAGKASVTIETNSKPRQQDVNFVADSSTAKLAQYRVDQDGAIADGTVKNRVKVVVQDLFGNPVPNFAVQLSATNGGKLDDENPTTDSQGEVLMGLSNTKAGTTSVSAAVNGQSDTVNTVFVANTATAKIDSASFVVEQDRMTANGGKNRVALRVIDAHDNPVPNYPVGFAATNGAVPDQASQNTDDQGRVGMAVTKATWGDTSVTATANTTSLNKPLTFIDFSGINNANAGGSGTSFTLDKQFPTTAMAGSNFRLMVNNQAAEADKFTWSSNSGSAITVSTQGVVTFASEPADRHVVITATDKQSGATLNYAFDVKYWAFVPTGGNSVSFTAAEGLCSAGAAILPSQNMIAQGTGVRGVGGLYGEWGDLSSKVSALFWSDNSGYHFHQNDGQYHANTTSVYATVCMKP